jgi:hypothetical protein
MKGTVHFTLVAAALTFVSLPAGAQGFQAQGSTTGTYSATPYPAPWTPPKEIDNVGRTGQFVFSIERITGLFIDRQKVTYKDPETGLKFEHTFKTTSFGLLGVDSASPSALPRFALDYVIWKGITAGVTGLVSTRGLSLDQRGEGQVPDAPPTAADDGLTLLGGLRAGYALPFDRTFGVWGRLGLSYASSSAQGEIIDPRTGDFLGDFERRIHYFDANIELVGVLSPVEHIVLTGGPYLDLPLGGGYSITADGGEIDRRDAHLLSFGLLIHAGGYY